MSITTIFLLWAIFILFIGFVINYLRQNNFHLITTFFLALLPFGFAASGFYFIKLHKQASNLYVVVKIGETKVIENPSDGKLIVEYNNEIQYLHEACSNQIGIDDTQNMIGEKIGVYQKKYLPIFNNNPVLDFIKFKSKPEIVFYYGTHPMSNKTIKVK